MNSFFSDKIKDGGFSNLLSLCKDCWQVCHTLIQAQRISVCAASDRQHLNLYKQVNRKQAEQKHVLWSYTVNNGQTARVL